MKECPCYIPVIDDDDPTGTHCYCGHLMAEHDAEEQCLGMIEESQEVSL